MEINRKGGRDGTRITRPIILSPSGSYSLIRKAELRREGTGKSSKLIYWDGTGSIFSYGPLDTGKYELAFCYSTTDGLAKNQRERLENVRVWSGTAVTKKVTFEVLRP